MHNSVHTWWTLLLRCCQEKQAKLTDDGDDSTALMDPPLWKCYWTKMQSMMLLSGLFMLIGSLLHLACPLLLILIVVYVENKSSIGNTAGNVTLPKVRLVSYLTTFFYYTPSSLCSFTSFFAISSLFYYKSK